MTGDQLKGTQCGFGGDSSIVDIKLDILEPHLLLSYYIRNFTYDIFPPNISYHPNQPETALSLPHVPFGYNMLHH